MVDIYIKCQARSHESFDNGYTNGMDRAGHPCTNPPGCLFFFLSLSAIFAWIRLYYGNILIQTIQASANFQVASRIFEDNSLLQKQLDNILYLFYFLSAGYHSLCWRNPVQASALCAFTGLELYLFNLGILVGFFLARLVL